MLKEPGEKLDFWLRVGRSPQQDLTAFFYNKESSSTLHSLHEDAT
ncbi:hypothetical protein [Lusitaniella coriacea]